MLGKALPAIAGALLAAGAFAVYAVAGHEQSVASYTACLNTKSGTLNSIAGGGAPTSPCGANELPIHLSGGDVTDVQTPSSGGLEGGTSNGVASLELQEPYRLPQACAGDDVPKWAPAEAKWVCAPDDASDGDVTGVTAGVGLTGGGTSGDVSLQLANGYRLPQGCLSGSVPTFFFGAWFCIIPTVVATTVHEQVDVCPQSDLTCTDVGAVNETARHVNVQASCPAGYTVTGGGFSASSDVEVTASHALGNRWRVLADGPAFGLISRSATAYATCARI